MKWLMILLGIPVLIASWFISISLFFLLLIIWVVLLFVKHAEPDNNPTSQAMRNHEQITILIKEIIQLKKEVHTLRLRVDALSKEKTSSSAQPAKPDIEPQVNQSPLNMPAMQAQVSTEYKEQIIELAENKIEYAAPKSQQNTHQNHPKTHREHKKNTLVFHRNAPQSVSNTQKDTAFPLWSWFSSGNWLLKVGMIISFLGFAFLLRFVSGYIEIPLSIRYLTVGTIGLLSGILGWRLRDKNRTYALSMQGFGLAIMYLTTLAALKLHPLLSPTTALLLMSILVIVMIVLAVRQDALNLAQVAVLGGMATPILNSTNSGQFIWVFAYLLILNIGVAAIAWHKMWKSLNLLGFIGTSFIFGAWIIRDYQPIFWLPTEFFLLTHWLLYTAIAWLFARHSEQAGIVEEEHNNTPTWAQLGKQIIQHLRENRGINSLLLLGSAILFFAYQHKITHTFENVAALSALLFSAVYGLLAWMAYQRNMRAISQTALLLSLFFLSLSIPLYFQQQWISAAWALEGLLIYILAISFRQPVYRLLGMIIIFIGMVLHSLQIHISYEEILLIGPIFASWIVLFSGSLLVWLGLNYLPRQIKTWEYIGINSVLFCTLTHSALLIFMLITPIWAIWLTAFFAFFTGLLQRNRILPGISLFIPLVIIFSQFFNTNGMVLTNWPIHPQWAVFLHAIATLLAAYTLHEAHWRKDAPHTHFSKFNLVAGWLMVIMALFSLAFSINKLLPSDAQLWAQTADIWALLLAFILLNGLIFFLHWQSIARLPLMYLPLAAFWICLLWQRIFHLHTLQLIHGEAIAENPFLGHAWQWFFLLIVSTLFHYFTLYRQRHDPISWQTPFHTIGGLFVVLFFSYFIGNQLAHTLPVDSMWRTATWSLTPLAIFCALYLTRHSKQWPITPFQPIYHTIIGSTLSFILLIWLISANIIRPGNLNFAYLPIINPLELSCILIFTVLFYFWHNNENLKAQSIQTRQWLYITSGTIVLMFISAAGMRLWHFYGAVDWRLDILLASFNVQATLSIMWTITAISLMLLGNRRHLPTLWFSGAILIGVVVVKLFLIELSNSNGLARIFSFIVVGLLLLGVGYFAPLPKNEPSDEA